MNNGIYYEEIESIIKKQEISKKARILEENYDTVCNYWNIGRLIVDAQGGMEKSKYGDKLIKEWSKELTSKYGKGYNYSNLVRFRQFYQLFPILATVSQVSWSHIVEVLPLKDKNKMNYYINLCINNRLSVRNLRYAIKDNTYERLVNKPLKVEIVSTNKEYDILDELQNPILIKLKNNEDITSEYDLEEIIYAQLNLIFRQLGKGFTYVDRQVKLTDGNKNYFIDLLLFNIELNSYVVVELKLRELRKEDKAQVEFYLNLVDKSFKKATQNKTIGIIISKKQDKFIANFIRSNKLFPLTYKLEKVS